MLKFNKWMIVNDVNMTSYVQLEWNCILVENQLFFTKLQ
jgi:hypothetical protein